MKTLLLVSALAGLAAAQGSVPAPQAEGAKAAAPAAVPAVALDSAAAVAPSQAPAPEKAEPAVAAKPVGVDEEWAFTKAAAADANSSVQKAAIADLDLFARRHPDAAQASESVLLAAELRQKNGEWQRAAMDLLRVVAEYPQAQAATRAKSDYLALIEKKASRRDRIALGSLVAAVDASDRADRLAEVLQALAQKAPGALYEPATAEVRGFLVRFPQHKDADKLAAALALLHAANNEPAAALLAWRRLLAMHPDSELRPRAQKAVGDLYADSLRDPRAAVAAYLEVVEKYPKAPEVQPALEGAARLFEEKLKQYDLAVEQHERIVKGFPKTPASLAALKSIARLQRDRLAKPDDAIKTLQRLSTMHGGQDGVDALLLAASIARRDLKDYGRQAALLHQVADDFPYAKEAPSALYDAAGVYESDLKNSVKAIEVYKEVATKFPAHRLAAKAFERAEKLAAAK